MNKQIKTLLIKASRVVDDKTSTTEEERQAVLDEIAKALTGETGTKWWFILLKVIAYAIGLILAGYGTTAAAATINII